MKKLFPILLIIVVFALVFQVVVTVFITEKEVDYVIKTEDNEFMISEHMMVIDDGSYYDFGITDKSGNNYLLSISENFNKQTEVIRDIKTFKSNDVSCIFPIYKRNVTGDISCLYKGEVVSYSYLKQIGNTAIDGIINLLKDDGYNHNSWVRVVPETVKLSQDGKGIEVFQENILKDYVFLIWRYKGLYILKNDESIIKDYLDNDQYDNQLSILVGRYYVTAVTGERSNAINEFVYYNTKELGKGKISFNTSTSSNYYFNGVYRNKLYLTDVGYGKQYVIDPAYETVEEIGNMDVGFTDIVDDKIVVVEPSEFLDNPVYFEDKLTNEDIITKYGEDITIVKDRIFYYFKTADGAIYRSHEDNPSNAELLFKFDNLVEWKIKNGDIIAVAGDKVYFYNDDEGLIPIVINNELKYNYKNIVDFWKK